jgi:predicted dehydrogenase
MNKECEVVALCATTYERARSVAGRLGVPGAYGDWHELIADPRVDAVAVATPPPMQPPIVLAALAARKPVFCEKPIAATRGQATEMLQAARRSGLANMVDFEFVALDEWNQAKEVIDQGLLGSLRHAAVTWHVETYAIRKKLKSWKTGSAESGGGVLNSAVSHVFHYIEWLLGPIHKLTARLSAPREHDGPAGETVAMLCLEMASGVSVTISVSNGAFQGTGHRVEVYGEEGSLVLENNTSEYVTVFQLRHGTRESKRPICVGGSGPAPNVPDDRIIPVGRLVDRFINWITTGVSAEPSFEHGCRVQYLLDCARQAHASEKWIGVAKSEAYG